MVLLCIVCGSSDKDDDRMKTQHFIIRKSHFRHVPGLTELQSLLNQYNLYERDATSGSDFGEGGIDQPLAPVLFVGFDYLL
jgi:hypothetical protein